MTEVSQEEASNLSIMNAGYQCTDIDGETRENTDQNGQSVDRQNQVEALTSVKCVFDKLKCEDI